MAYPRYCWAHSATCEARIKRWLIEPTHPPDDCHECACADVEHVGRRLELECRCIALRCTGETKKARKKPGRQKQPYPELELAPKDAGRLRQRLITTYEEEGPYLERWWNSAKHERWVDGLIGRWEKSYRATHPADYKRASDNLDGKAHTNSEATVQKKVKRTVSMQAQKLDASIDDEPIFLIDYMHLTKLYPYLKKASRLKPFNREWAYFDAALIDKAGHRVGLALDRQLRNRREEFKEFLAAIRREEAESLIPCLADYPGGRYFVLTYLEEPEFALKSPTIAAQKRILEALFDLWQRSGGNPHDTTHDLDFDLPRGWQRKWLWRYERGAIARLWPSDKNREYYEFRRPRGYEELIPGFVPISEERYISDGFIRILFYPFRENTRQSEVNGL